MSLTSLRVCRLPLRPHDGLLGNVIQTVDASVGDLLPKLRNPFVLSRAFHSSCRIANEGSGGECWSSLWQLLNKVIEQLEIISFLYLSATSNLTLFWRNVFCWNVSGRTSCICFRAVPLLEIFRVFGRKSAEEITDNWLTRLNLNKTRDYL